MRKLHYLACASLVFMACGNEEKSTQESPEAITKPAADKDTVIVIDPATGEETIQLVEPNTTNNNTSRTGRTVSFEEIRQMEKEGFVVVLDNGENEALKSADGSSTTRILHNRTMFRKGEN